jgi:two-component system response regulator
MAPRTFLLVEDNPDDAEMAVLAFGKTDLGIQIDHAVDGVEALEYLLPPPTAARATKPLPSAVLLDLKLPRVSGLEVLQRLRADPRTKLLPVVVLTSSSHPADVVSSYDLGCNSYVRKPVDFERFLEVARYLGIYWLDVNEAAVALS